MVSLFLSLCVIAIGVIAVSPKQLHLFELLFTWMVITYVQANAYSIISLNEEMLLIPKQLDKYGILVLGSYTVVPILIVACQNVLIAVHSLLTKIGVIIACVMCLVAIESWEVVLHILERRNWHFYHSFLFWLSMVLVITVTRALFHQILKQEVEI